MSDLEENEEKIPIQGDHAHFSNFAIPYVGPAPAPGGGGLFPELRNSEINISMMAERRSSLEYVPPNAEAESGSGFSSLIHSTAVVKQSSVIRPTPLSKIESQTNLNLPPTNWLKDNPSSKGDSTFLFALKKLK